MNIMVAIGDMTKPISLQFLQYYVDNLKSHLSVGGIGIEGEYTQYESLALMTQARDIILASGKWFNNYYVKPATLIPAGGGSIFHTNWPSYQKEVELKFAASSPTVGISSGYYAYFPFPETRLLPTDPKVSVDGYGWQKAAVAKCLSYPLNLPANTRQFVNLCVGMADSFIGVSGITHTDLWDNLVLRRWIWKDPSYRPNFLLSTS
jgi:hypothetical protein